jgi:hypothetical protein
MIIINRSEFLRDVRGYLYRSVEERVIISCGEEGLFELVPGKKMNVSGDCFADADIIELTSLEFNNTEKGEETNKESGKDKWYIIKVILTPVFVSDKQWLHNYDA